MKEEIGLTTINEEEPATVRLNQPTARERDELLKKIILSNTIINDTSLEHDLDWNRWPALIEFIKHHKTFFAFHSEEYKFLC